MSNYTITCCSTCDMPLKFFSDHQISFACFHFNLDGQDHIDDLGQSMSFEQFYDRIAKGATPTTSQVSVGEYLALFEPILQSGQDILHITLSSGLSGTFSSAQIARETLLETYPDREIVLVDSLGASSGYGMLVDSAAKLKQSGATLHENQQWLNEHKLHLHHWFFSTDLTSYYRGGRISAASALFGTALKICPLLNMDNSGHLIPRTKFRGKKKVAEEIVARMEEHATDGLNYSGKCFISHSACYEDARAVADMVEKRFKKLDGNVLINSVGTVIGSHTGPGTVALFFYGDHRTD